MNEELNAVFPVPVFPVMRFTEPLTNPPPIFESSPITPEGIRSAITPVSLAHNINLGLILAQPALFFLAHPFHPLQRVLCLVLQSLHLFLPLPSLQPLLDRLGQRFSWGLHNRRFCWKMQRLNNLW